MTSPRPPPDAALPPRPRIARCRYRTGARHRHPRCCRRHRRADARVEHGDRRGNNDGDRHLQPLDPRRSRRRVAPDRPRWHHHRIGDALAGLDHGPDHHPSSSARVPPSDAPGTRRPTGTRERSTQRSPRLPTPREPGNFGRELRRGSWSRQSRADAAEPDADGDAPEHRHLRRAVTDACAARVDAVIVGRLHPGERYDRHQHRCRPGRHRRRRHIEQLRHQHGRHLPRHLDACQLDARVPV